MFILLKDRVIYAYIYIYMHIPGRIQTQNLPDSGFQSVTFLSGIPASHTAHL